MNRRTIYRLGLSLGIVLGIALIFAWLLPGSLLSLPASTPEPSPTPEFASKQYLAMRPDAWRDIDDFENGVNYWLDLTLEEPAHLTGRERIRYVNKTQDSLSVIVLRTYLNALAGETALSISDTRVDGQLAASEWADGNSVFQIPLKEEIGPGESIEITLQFALVLSPDVRISYGRLANHDGVVVLSAFFPQLSVYENGGWWTAWPSPQGDPAYSEAALFDVTLTAPSELKVASTGVILTSVKLENNTTEYTIVTGPVRDFSLAVSRDFELLSATQDDVTINIWSAPGDSDADHFALDKALAALRTFDEQFGAYPLAELDIVEAPIDAGGIEYPGLVYLADSIWEKGNDFFEVVLAHEISHQWWYGVVGDNQVEQPWVDEALADYSVEVYYRQSYGENAGRNIRDQYQESLDQYLASGARQMPVDLPVSAYDGYQYGVFVYMTGALFYSHLYEDYDPALLRDFLRAFYQQYRYRIAHTEDLRRMVGEFFGADAETFFDEWIEGR
jgi:hypothetical protein